MWLTLLWHVGTGLPWAWRTGPSDSSERGHLEEMLAELPENSLITADAGFVGYDFWKAILNAGHHFVIRVGANVRLIKQLGYARQHDHTVYLWPDAAAKKKQPPLVLRLIVIHDGKHPVYLVTNLTKSQLSDRQAGDDLLRTVGNRTVFSNVQANLWLPQTTQPLGGERQTRIGLVVAGLVVHLFVGAAGVGRTAAHDPTWLSAAATIKAFQGTLREYRVRPESPEESLGRN